MTLADMGWIRRRPGRWIPTASQFALLVAGCWLYGCGEAMVVAAGLGNSPWTTLAQGVSRRSGLDLGLTTNLIGAVVLPLWVPLRQRPGLGTVFNGVLVGVSIDVTLNLVLPVDLLMARVACLAAGIVAVAAGSGLYLGCAMGPGPRDGLMTGLHNRTHLPLAVVRVALETSVLGAGMLLGGTAGVGTVLFALLVGPGVQLALGALNRLTEFASRRSPSGPCQSGARPAR